VPDNGVKDVTKESKNIIKAEVGRQAGRQTDIDQQIDKMIENRQTDIHRDIQT